MAALSSCNLIDRRPPLFVIGLTAYFSLWSRTKASGAYRKPNEKWAASRQPRIAPVGRREVHAIRRAGQHGDQREHRQREAPR
jgi:hypothetical protein